MIRILNDGYGQMCNKLISQIGALSSSYIHGYTILYYNRDYYDGFSQNAGGYEENIRFVTKKKITLRMFLFKISRTIKKSLNKGQMKYVLMPEDEINFNMALQSDYYLKHNASFVGWPYMDIVALRKAIDAVRLYLEPDESIKKFVTDKMQLLKPSDDICVVGVHMRRGDYKTWKGGKYYYSDKQYKDIILKTTRAIRDTLKAKCRFVLVSNESIDLDFFRSTDDQYVVSAHNGSAAQDFHLLSKCDYLIGPPSTFSGLASLFGNVPRYMVEDANMSFTINDFRVWLLETDS